MLQECAYDASFTACQAGATNGRSCNGIGLIAGSGRRFAGSQFCQHDHPGKRNTDTADCIGHDFVEIHIDAGQAGGLLVAANGIQ